MVTLIDLIWTQLNEKFNESTFSSASENIDDRKIYRLH